MPLYFRRSIKLFPGVRLNFGKKSTSVSFGPRGAKITKGTNGTHVSVGVPGTGVYYRKKISSPKKNSQTDYSDAHYNKVPIRTKSENQTWGGIFLVLGLFLIAMAIFASLQTVGRYIIGGIGAFCLLASTAYYTAKSSDDKQKDISMSTKANFSVEINWFPIVLGAIMVAFCVILFVSSLSWEWTGHSKSNIYIRYDFNWLKWLLYPFLLLISILGLSFVRVGFTKKD